MPIFPVSKPRRFSYLPGSHNDKKGRKDFHFRRFSRGDPHFARSSPKIYLLLVVLVAVAIYLLGGFHSSAIPPSLSEDDALIQRNEIPESSE